SVFVNLMLTPGSTAPAESFTVPMIVPVVTCAVALPPKSNRQKKSLNPSCLRIMRSSPILLTQNSPSLPATLSWEDRNKTKRICGGCYNNTEPPRQSLFRTEAAVYRSSERVVNLNRRPTVQEPRPDPRGAGRD